ncbi:maleylpyruvate isomerase family mycothiol-dependent enzyme [Aeromicrobium ginsengisoli]|uniref:maleylpyruvate isomerase family mycothiol-dependent enzyme n=1 Tax=Aeromicrobium ginsengisoli TaxID=363867 RepID=UPI00165EED3E|nr:maleylpyruvate isomerase family mycothiol-dependent enzyme [Aeromicrobium ginsengisoli]
MNLLDTYVRGWHESAESIVALAAELDAADWARQTDCTEWTVKDVLAHLAHLESELCRSEQSTYDSTGGSDVVSAYTALGVEARRDRTPAELVEEFAAAVDLRAARLADLPDDPAAPAPVTPGGVAWSWDTLLRNRSVDVWVHEQDIRRATGRPGGLDSTGAHVAVMTFSFAMPFVLGKKVRPPATSTVRWNVTGETPLELVVRIGEDGRASAIETLDEPSATLTMSTETFTVLTAGRRAPDQVDVAVEGDEELARATLGAMAIMS